MSEALGPLAALVGPAAAPVAHWLQLVKVADPESIRRVCSSHGRGSTTRTANRVIRELVDAGLATAANRPHTSRVVIATGAMLSPRTLGHELIVSRVSAIAMECGWSWERDVADRNEHLADGILTDEDGRRIGVEVEMTRKTIKRTRQILVDHGRAEFRYTGVVYIGTADTMRYISDIATRTGTANVLRGVAPAVAKWNQDIDNDLLTQFLTDLRRTSAPAPHQLTFDAPSPPPTAPRTAEANGGPATAAASASGRRYSDDAFVDFRTPIDPSTLTDADRRAGRIILANRLNRADISGDERTASNVRRRQQELGLA